MSFKSYSVEKNCNGSVMLTDPQPLVFSGRNGLIAKFVQAEPNRASQPWKLCSGELHAIAFPAGLVHDRAIFFEQSEDADRSIMWLQAVSGISGCATEMMFSFEPLVVERTRPLVVRRMGVERTYGEDLSLDGGVDDLNGTWRWKKPHLVLGGVVLGGRSKAPAASDPLG